MESPHAMIIHMESKEIIFDHVRKRRNSWNNINYTISDWYLCRTPWNDITKYFYAEALKDNPDADEADFRTSRS